MFKEMNTTKRTVNEGIDTKEFPFTKLKDYVGRNVRIWGYFFTNGKYGKQLVCVTDSALINMPKRYVGTFDGFTDNEIDAIKSGCLVLSNIRMIDSDNGTTVTFDYDDYLG